MRGFIKGVAPSTSLSFFLFLRKYLGPYGENCTFLKKKWLIIVDSQIFKLYLRPEIKRKNEIDYRFIHYYFLIYNIMNKTGREEERRESVYLRIWFFLCRRKGISQRCESADKESD